MIRAVSLEDLLGDHARVAKAPVNIGIPEAQAETLKERFAELNVVHDFKPGDVVRWKRGLCMANDRAKDDPLLVVDVDLTGYQPAVMDLRAQKYRQDIAVMFVEMDGHATIDLLDRRFFEPFVPTV